MARRVRGQRRRFGTASECVGGGLAGAHNISRTIYKVSRPDLVNDPGGAPADDRVSAGAGCSHRDKPVRDSSRADPLARQSRDAEGRRLALSANATTLFHAGQREAPGPLPTCRSGNRSRTCNRCRCSSACSDRSAGRDRSWSFSSVWLRGAPDRRRSRWSLERKG